MARPEECCLTFRDFFKRDCSDPRAFFDTGAFADELNIEGRKVTGLFLKCTDSDSPSAGTEGYTSGSARLYLRSQGIKGVSAGQTIRVNGTVWTVKSHDIIGGCVRRIMLEAVDP